MNVYNSKKLRISFHILFWAFIWSFMLLTTNEPNEIMARSIVDISIDVIPLMIPFYFNMYFLIPKFLKKGKVHYYFSSLIVLIITGWILYFLTVRGAYFLIYKMPLIPKNKLTLNQNLNITFWNVVLSIAVSTFIKLIYDYLFFNRYIVKIENEKLKYEISFLKSQINPHFLFNIINSIYFQIEQKNLLARDSLEKLSNLLRYTLYEADKDIVLIEQEINFIKTYFELQKIRLENFDNVNLILDVNNSFKIKPLLLMPLIENAFKFYTPNKINSFINILIKDLNLEKLSIEVSNSYSNTNNLNLQHGLGLVNLKHRLEIFYNTNYFFKIHHYKRSRYNFKCF